MEKIAVVSGQDPQAYPSEIGEICDSDAILGASRLATASPHFNLAEARQSPTNFYTALDSSFDKAFVLKDEVWRLLESDFNAAWVAHLLLDMGEGSEVYMELTPAQRTGVSAVLKCEYLQSRIPSAGAEIIDDRWTVLRWSSELAKETDALKSIYPSIHGSVEDFVAEWMSEFGLTPGEQSPEAEEQRALGFYHYRYTVIGANNKSFYLQRVIEECFGDKKVIGLDVAGGFGFIGAEMAIAGHTFHVGEYESEKINVGRRFLGKRGLTERLTLEQGDAKDVGTYSQKFDIVTIFEALYSIGKRDIVPGMFREAMALLNEGGVLSIKEGSLQGGRDPADPIYHTLFELNELIDCLKENAGEPEFFNPNNRNYFTRDQLQERSLAALVRK